MATDSSKAPSTGGVFAPENQPKIGMAGAGIAALGSFLPWYQVLGAQVLGVEGDGLITLVIAIVLLGLLYARPWERTTIILTAIGGLLITLIALYHVTNYSAVGVYATLLGGALTLATAVFGLRN